MVRIPDPDIRGLNVQIACLERDRASILLASGRSALIDGLREYLEFVAVDPQEHHREHHTDAHLWDRLREMHETYEARLHTLLRSEHLLEKVRLQALEETASG